MISFDELISDIQAYNSSISIETLRNAYNVASAAHGEQLRKSGEPYMIHPMEVTRILARLRMDGASLVAGLLHDVVEDTKVTLEEIETHFGKEVGELVDGITKLNRLSFVSRHEHQAENFRKMIVAMGKDLRVILIKLADRLHNMRTLQFMEAGKQVEIAQETLDIYAPITNRLGIEWLRIELEDLSLRYLKPETYYKLIQLIAKEQKARETYIEEVISVIQEKLKEAQFTDYIIKGRPKHLYSIYKKMEKSNLSFEEIHDIIGFRIITRNLQACYEALGIIHSTWKPVPGRFKDYIAMPKANMYQSLHTTVIGPMGERIEIQIRTEEMDRIAEQGIAAHWIYKENGTIKPEELEKFGWIRHLLEWQQELKDSSEFMQALKVDLFADEVYVFSPKGDVLALPRGATPIDFAYAIHSRLGDRCTGAKVSNRIVPLNHELRNGDTIEILTSEHQVPRKDWLDFVVTSKAKNKIRQHIKKEQSEQSKQIGETLLEKEFRKKGINFQKLVKKGEFEQLRSDFHVANVDELLIKVGYGKINPADIAAKFTETPAVTEAAKESLVDQIIKRVSRKTTSPVKIRGIDDVLIRFAHCCNPVPGDTIVGFITRGRGITVHTTDCPKILNYDEQRKIEVLWDTQQTTSYLAKISILSVDRPGVLAEITRVLSNNGGNITHAYVRTTPDKKAVTMFEISVVDVDQLHLILNALEKIDGVISAERVRG